MFGPLPPFSLTNSRDDMSTFSGRCAYFYRSINPMKCLDTDRSIMRHRMLLDSFRSKTLPNANDATVNAQLWEAREAIEASVHPKTQQLIPAPFRMAAFIPVNLFIVPFMLLPSTIASPVRTIGIHWFNQSFNSLINYSNRAGDDQPLSQLFAAYMAAVTVSVTGALSATVLMRRMGSKPSFATTVVRAVIPCVSVAFAGSANLAMMRRNEWMTDGLDVKDEDGQVRGKSLQAGRASLVQCSAARVLWNIPCMMAPPLLSAPLQQFSFFAARPIVTETALCVLGMAVGVAPALAFYPPTITVDASSLEPSFHNLTRANGQPVKTLTFYKGL